MATFIVLMNFTEQGIKSVKDSPARYEAFKAAAGGLDIAVKSVYWTVGHYDIVLTVEGHGEYPARPLFFAWIAWSAVIQISEASDG